MIGEFLGKEREYMSGLPIRVLHEYVDMMDFTGMNIDQAIRKFLQGFRLPGEAQKIDRMMEKFAERYCMQNKDAFTSPDTAFVLGFSIIMLNTDLHNPNIREDKKMTKEEFVRNNRGISDGNDLSEEYLSGVYDRIAKQQISLKEDDALRTKKAQSATMDMFSSTAQVTVEQLCAD